LNDVISDLPIVSDVISFWQNILQEQRQYKEDIIYFLIDIEN
jgi:hypothetical protein